MPVNTWQSFALDPSISVQIEAPPEADVVFLPISSDGHQSPLSQLVLDRLNLQIKPPRAHELRSGYHFQMEAQCLLCFLVTASSLRPEATLNANLTNALADSTLAGARSLWLPLLWTADAGLSLAMCLSITVDCLRSSHLGLSGALNAVISIPLDIPQSQQGALADAIGELSKPVQAHASLYVPVDESAATSTSVTELLAYAMALARVPVKPRERLSTTLIFFALTESQSEEAPAALRADMDAELFSAAVQLLAGDSYASQRSAYFGSSQRVAVSSQPPAQLEATANAKAVLDEAHRLAKGMTQGTVQISHLVHALLHSKKGNLLKILEAMSIEPLNVLKEFNDARRGTVDTRFTNDVAADTDRLGYQTYASAIADFLTNAKTPAPLSISIQAPWGGGKSSLMQLVREALDPRLNREQPNPSVAGATAATRLIIRNVLQFLEQKDNFTITPDSQVRGKGPTRLWTIWFNAWKYDTTEQVWAGLVDAIVSQVAERLPLIEREKFLFRLQMARIDDGIVRKRLYDRVINAWWVKVRGWTMAGVAAILSLYGSEAVAPVLPKPLQDAISQFGNTAAGVTQILLGVYLIANYFTSRSKTLNEPATFSLAEYIQIPDYAKSVGDIHQVHADLKRVLNIVPKLKSDTEHSPLVIFIDDLDRCSPNKVASVVEGVSMLLASETYRCMFVIGMDPQMVAAALEKAHEDVRLKLPRYERAVPLGWRFMDKFIQLPFTIPPCEVRQFDGYIGHLMTPLPSEPAVTVNRDASATSTPSEQAPLTSNRNEKQPVASVKTEPASSKANIEFIESREVGAIVRLTAAYAVGNPREMKRMVNLVRFYLSLRTARRKSDPAWRSPGQEQYARWVALTLRWPDMLRWLQWGADEAHWPPAELGTALVVRRLRALENNAAKFNTAATWRQALSLDLGITVESDSSWGFDPKLFEFFKAEAQLDKGKRLSDAASRGFW
ncbi:KAP family P-loop NTPase fold protein [Pseudomonas sp. UFMG81]|uniref:KAP family P-loop NTPase fold protein n=1 Tax=Pseudomonas sp. UFMG81 TaxID=2745936 RepID=UPI00188FE9F4|nr:P-loop NTPase fold protein [Pseudomonas sp. UFMG81]